MITEKEEASVKEPRQIFFQIRDLYMYVPHCVRQFVFSLALGTTECAFGLVQLIPVLSELVEMSDHECRTPLFI